MGELRVAALIPVFDGAGTIDAVVRGARRRVEHVVVVDDGSSDGSAERALEAGAEVLRHGGNRGKGAALRTGLAHLLGRGFTHAFTLDADGPGVTPYGPSSRFCGVARSERSSRTSST